MNPTALSGVQIGEAVSRAFSELSSEGTFPQPGGGLCGCRYAKLDKIMDSRSFFIHNVMQQEN